MDNNIVIDKYIDVICEECKGQLVLDYDFDSDENEIDYNEADLDLLCVDCDIKYSGVFVCSKLERK